MKERVQDTELRGICDRLFYMGQRCVEAIRESVNALVNNDGQIGRKIIQRDDEIDDLEKQISADCIRFISLRGPVASDLRLLTLAMRAVGDLERVGDEACSIAKRIPELSGNVPLRIDTSAILDLSDRVLALLQDALAAFIDRDAAMAAEISGRDREIDAIHRQHVRQLIEKGQGDHSSISDVVDMIFISKSLERVGDHAKNLAEEVVFLVDGTDIRHTRRPNKTLGPA